MELDQEEREKTTEENMFPLTTVLWAVVHWMKGYQDGGMWAGRRGGVGLVLVPSSQVVWHLET